MPLHRQLPVGFLHIGPARVPWQAQDVVAVPRHGLPALLAAIKLIPGIHGTCSPEDISEEECPHRQPDRREQRWGHREEGAES